MLVYNLNGRKKKQTGTVYYFHKGEHFVKFKYDKKLLKHNEGEKQKKCF